MNIDKGRKTTPIACHLDRGNVLYRNSFLGIEETEMFEMFFLAINVVAN
jgi:hypothetical protein